MKLKEYLEEEQITKDFFKEMLAEKGIVVSDVAFWKWYSGLGYPRGDKIAIIQRLTNHKVQAVDWYDGKVQ
tara:strand:+ start:4876 stop:5088 length:213 start_codon:yes stop_codon:yes gene_type:complete